MRAILNIAITQFTSQLRQRGAILTSFVVPVLMVIGIGTFTQFRYSTAIFDVVRGDDALADTFVRFLRADGKVQIQGADRFVLCDLARPTEQPPACQIRDLGSDLAAAAMQRMEAGTSGAVITLPENFTTALKSGGEAVVTVAVRNNPQFEQVVSQYVEAVNVRLNGAIQAARVATEKAGGDTAFFDKVYAAAEAQWEKNPVAIQETSTTITGTNAGSGFGQSAPGVGAMFVMLNALSLAQLFITERQNWTLQRLMVMPITRAQLLAGKLLGQYFLGLLTFAVMLTAGVALGVRLGDPLGVIVIVLTYTLAVTALALALSTLVRTVGQASGVSLLVSLTLAPLGGAWWPLDITPQFMQTFGKIVSPIAWSQQAFNQMVFYGATFQDILPSAGVLLLFAAVFFAFGVVRFRHE